MNIVALTWPIFIEVLLRTALNTSDVFMLSGYSDKAVSAVGVINPITFFFIIISMMVTTGTGILIGQYNGASRSKEAVQVGIASVLLALVVGLLLGLISYFFAADIIRLYDLDADVAQYAYDYLIISGSLTIFITLGIVFSTIMRSYGHSKPPMYINLFCGVLNVMGNYCALYQPFGLPVYGVQGVAIATVTSQAIGALILWGGMIKYRIAPPLSKIMSVPTIIYKKILKIGVMNASEILSYNLSQMAIVYLVVKMGTASLTAFTYAQNISRLSFAFALALGQASQIQTSYFIGKGLADEILNKVKRYFVAGFIISTTVTLILFIWRFEISGLFTEDPEVILFTAGLITASIFVESGRVFNLIFISALKGAGDIKFPVQIGILSMWGIAFGFSYLLGIYFALGVIGVWIAMGLDEWVRGLIMMRRWGKQGWVKFSLI
ncbi:MATE family efflux transporter [Vibrio sp. SS-MA-C1-2]|uniref:MATE family efflux transporter n=1 Tax=Vibrio sp. SS-MA-C1-2 TaxID=2908646 RepID=UPI001F4853E6|nr:MATE family efflux transporter [Vibrio sp. SS-MA-C1-2]UJF17628.1 MATE family efflux transporter [Vibrio sp. SS-MA-C1-2]